MDITNLIIIIVGDYFLLNQNYRMLLTLMIPWMISKIQPLEIEMVSRYFYSNDKKHCVKVYDNMGSTRCIYSKVSDFLEEYITKSIVSDYNNNQIVNHNGNTFCSTDNKEYTVFYKDTRIIIIKYKEGTDTKFSTPYFIYCSKIHILIDFTNFLKTYKKQVDEYSEKFEKYIPFYYSTLNRIIYLTSYSLHQIPENPIIDKVVLDNLCKDIDNFEISKEKYILKNKYYKRTYLFEGLPGTGKTSLIKFLALKYKRSVYTVNLDTFSTVESLISNISHNIKPDSIVVFEDFACKDKDDSITQVSEKTASIPKKDLINLFDGMLCPFNGQIVIMTTNYIENIDPVLIRPGRIDYRINFTYASREQIDIYLKQETLDFPDKIINKYVGKATIAEIIYKIETNTFV